MRSPLRATTAGLAADAASGPAPVLRHGHTHALTRLGHLVSLHHLHSLHLAALHKAGLHALMYGVEHIRVGPWTNDSQIVC